MILEIGGGVGVEGRGEKESQARKSSETKSSERLR